MILAERNRFDGRIVSVKLGSLVAHVIVQIGGNEIESIVTRQSADEMKLKPGDPITVVIRSTEVMLSGNAMEGGTEMGSGTQNLSTPQPTELKSSYRTA